MCNVLMVWTAGRFIDEIQVLSDAQVDRLRSELAAISDPAHPGHHLWHEFHSNEAPSESGMVLFHSLGAWRISPAFHDVLFHPAYLVPAMQLMGKERVRLWHDQLFCKPPRQGSVVAWHQDMSYWTRVTPINHLTVHVALDNQFEDNGALHYVPGAQSGPPEPSHAVSGPSPRSLTCIDPWLQGRTSGRSCPSPRCTLMTWTR